MTDEDGDYWLERYEQDGEISHLGRAIDWYEQAIADRPETARRWWHWLGMARHERGTRTGDIADLDRAVELHLLVLGELSPDSEEWDTWTEMLVEACGELCFAFRERARLDGTAADLDLAVTVGRLPGETDDPALNYALAVALHDRWEAGHDPEDLNAAIAHVRRGVDVNPVPAVLAECGSWLLERESGGDADAAIALLERAKAEGDQCSWPLGMAYHLRWRVAHDRTDLDRALDQLEDGLAEVPDPSWLAVAHQERLALARERVEAEEAADPTRVPPGTTPLRGQVEAALAVFRTGAGDPDDRARLALELALCGMHTWQSDFDRVNSAWLREMVATARTLRDDRPSGWDVAMDFLDGVADGIDELKSGGHQPSEATEALFALLRRLPDDPEQRGTLTESALQFTVARAFVTADQRMRRAAIDRLRESEDPEERMTGEVLEIMDRAQHDDPSAPEAMRSLADRVKATPLSRPGQESLLPMVDLFKSVLAGSDGVYRPVDRTPIPPGDLKAADVALQAVGGPALAAMTRHDVETMRECADRLDEILERFPPGHLLRLVATGIACMVGVELLGDEPGDQDACHRLLRWTEEGIAIARGAHHPRWSTYAFARAEALRHLEGGDRAESRHWGLACLRGYAWRVMLQSGTDDAVRTAAEAGAAARRIAGWCQADGAIDDAIAALDTGRGLVLQAATTSRAIPDRLIAAGRSDLAERWRSSAGYGEDAITGMPLPMTSGGGLEVPDELRTKVLHTLDMSTAPPASAADIRAALRTAGADALIYLVPSSQYQPGAAVVVPVESEPATLILPGLTTDSGSAFRAGTAKARDAGPVPGEDAGAGARSEGPEDLCRWAWRSGMEPVLRHLGLDRPARLVLVPTGALSTVPWHAAFATSGGERRYAVEDAVISYAISARAFAESASRPRRDIKSVLIVGDPTAELPFAGLEARAVNHAFYPGGTWLGDTDGTPGKVLDWVAAAAPGPSLLHLACHGFADPAHPADACLRLAGGDLTARALLEASRTARLEIEQVFLAACTTGAEGADHDEMFSLSTAFLAAGARTVFGSLWAVPDEATSLLMFMVHHFLVVDRRPPVDALREAQLWMLDPKREAPAEMPRELARHASDPEAADPRSWAAFTHRGR